MRFMKQIRAGAKGGSSWYWRRWFMIFYVNKEYQTKVKQKLRKNCLFHLNLKNWLKNYL